MIKTQIKVNDQGISLSIDVRIWKNHDGHGIAALDPKDDASRKLMIEQRAFLKNAIAEKYKLQDLACYESQGNGLYTPTIDTMLKNGASFKESELVRFANGMESQGWKRTQDLAQNQLPPTPEV